MFLSLQTLSTIVLPLQVSVSTSTVCSCVCWCFVSVSRAYGPWGAPPSSLWINTCTSTKSAGSSSLFIPLFTPSLIWLTLVCTKCELLFGVWGGCCLLSFLCFVSPSQISLPPSQLSFLPSQRSPPFLSHSLRCVYCSPHWFRGVEWGRMDLRRVDPDHASRSFWSGPRHRQPDGRGAHGDTDGDGGVLPTLRQEIWLLWGVCVGSILLIWTSTYDLIFILFLVFFFFSQSFPWTILISLTLFSLPLFFFFTCIHFTSVLHVCYLLPQVFYWTHLLYIAFWTLCILHGPHFWKWFVVPGIVFLIERIHRSIRMRTGSGKTYIR